MMSFKLDELVYTIDELDEIDTGQGKKVRIWITGLDYSKESIYTKTSFDSSELLSGYTDYDIGIYIEPNAFAGSAVEKVILDRHVKLVYTDAFLNCKSLKEIYLTDTVGIQFGAFTGCTSVKEISGIAFNTNNSQPTYLPFLGYLFGGSSALDNATIVPKTLEELYEVGALAPGCFSHCATVKSIEFKTYPSIIPDNTFSGCASLCCLTSKERPTINPGVLNLTSMTEIGKEAFYGCLAFNTIYYKLAKSTRSKKARTVQNNLTIKFNAFKCCNNLFRIFTDCPNFIKGSASYGGIAAYAIFISKDVSSEPESISESDYFDYDKVRYYYKLTSVLENNTLDTTKIKLDATDITAIHLINKVGAKHRNLREIIISDKIKLIGTYCFSDCPNLQTVTFEGKNVTIGAYAFNNCNNLKTIQLSTISSWLTNTFNYPQTLWKHVELLKYDTNYSKIVGLVPSATTSILEIDPTLDNLQNVDTVPANAFMYAKFFDTVKSLDNKIVNINAYSFYGCSNLKNLINLDNLNYLHETAFAECSSSEFANLKVLGGLVFGLIQPTATSCIIDHTKHRQFIKDAFKNSEYLETIYFTGTLKEWCQLKFMNEYANPLYTNNANTKNQRKLVLNYNLDIPNSGILWDYTLSLQDFCDVISLNTGEVQIQELCEPYVFSGVVLDNLRTTDISNSIFLDNITNFDSIFKNTHINTLYCSSTFLVGLNSTIISSRFNKVQLKNLIVDSGTFIPNNAFNNSITLQTLTLNRNIQTVDHDAFFNCPALTAVYYEGPLVGELSWSTIRFKNEAAQPLSLNIKQTTTTSQVSVYCQINDNFVKVNNYAAIDGFCTSQLLPYTFLNFFNLSRFTFDSTKLKGLNNSAFANCFNLREISTFNDSDSSIFNAITDRTSGSPSGAYIIKHTTDQGIKNIVVYGTPGSYTIGAPATEIASGALSHSKTITSLTITPDISFIGAGLLNNCTNLLYLEVPFLGPSSNCDKYLVSNNGKQFKQLQTSFGYIFGLPIWVDSDGIIIEDGHSSIKLDNTKFTFVLNGPNIRLFDYCFYSCDFIKHFYLTGQISIMDTNSLDIDNANTLLAPTSIKTAGNYKGFTASAADTDIVLLTKIIANEADIVQNKKLYLFIPDSVKYIYKNAGTNYIDYNIITEKKLSIDLTIPQSVVFVGDGAFTNCTFNTVNIKAAGQLAANIFAGSTCGQLIIASSVAREQFKLLNNGYSAIYMLTNISKAILPISFCPDLQSNYNTLQYVGINTSGAVPAGSFRGCTALKTIELLEEATISAIESRAFINCSSLENFPWEAISNTCLYIKAEAFYGCAKLRRVILPYRLNPLNLKTSVAWVAACPVQYYVRIPEGGKYTFASENLTASYQELFLNSFGQFEETISKPFSQDIEFAKDQLIKISIMAIAPTSAVPMDIGTASSASCSFKITSDIFYLISSSFNGALAASQDLVKLLNADTSNLTWAVSSKNTVHPIKNKIMLNQQVSTIVRQETFKLMPCDINIVVGEQAFTGCTSLVEIVNDADLPLEYGATSFGSIAYKALSIINTRELGAVNTNIIDINNFICVNESHTSNITLIDYCGNEETIEIPTIITKVRTGTFNAKHSACKFLAIPNDVCLEELAINGCEELTQVTMANPRTISSNAFANCNKLSTIIFQKIDNRICNIIGNPVYRCPTFSTFKIESPVDSTNCKYVIETSSSLPGLCCLVEKTGNSRTLLAAGLDIAKINIQDTDTLNLIFDYDYIGDYALQSCSSIQTVPNIKCSFADCLIQIGIGAFMSFNIIEVDFSSASSLARIDNFAFKNCNIVQVTSLGLSSTARDLYIGSYAFANNKIANKEFILSRNIKEVGSNILAYNSAIETILAEHHNEKDLKAPSNWNMANPELGTSYTVKFNYLKE